MAVTRVTDMWVCTDLLAQLAWMPFWCRALGSEEVRQNGGERRSDGCLRHGGENKGGAWVHQSWPHRQHIRQKLDGL
jgi:hypothetical protein